MNNLKKRDPPQKWLSREKITTDRIAFVFLIGLLIIVFGYIEVQKRLDQNNYTSGHKAYQQADCETAIRYYDRIINAWRLVQHEEYMSLAEEEKAECLKFQVAVEKQQAQDFSAALIAYMEFLEIYGARDLGSVARVRIARFIEAGLFAVADQELCDQLETLLQRDLFPDPTTHLPPFYLACGQIYDITENWQRSFDLYLALLKEYPDHALAPTAESALLSNPLSCEENDPLKQESSILARVDFFPKLYYECGQLYEMQNEPLKSFDVYLAFLNEYPDHSLATEVETSLLANPLSCDRTSTIQNTVLSERLDFMPTLYHQCGQAYQAKEQWSEAIRMYELFLADYASHPLAAEVEQGLALAIVDQAREISAGEIPTPERSGSIAGEVTEVIIQNESPERLRIVFSGPDIRVEELGACSTCIIYFDVGPLVCPEQGPIGRYQLSPGQYDVVVEAISGQDTTPWTGNWTLSSSSEYYYCFFILTTIVP